MFINLKRFLTILLLSLLAIVGMSWYAGAQDLLATVVQAEGEVYYQPRDKNVFRPVEKDQPLYWGDLLLAQPDATLVIECNANQARETVPDNDEPWPVAQLC